MDKQAMAKQQPQVFRLPTDDTTIRASLRVTFFIVSLSVRREQTTTTARLWLGNGLGREADFSTSLRFGRNDDAVVL
jgi:hypothetical protein